LWWGDREPSKARHCFNTALWRLRQVLEALPSHHAPFLIVEANEIGFNTNSDFWLDVDEFEKMCALARQLGPGNEEATANALKRAVALYRDDLLPDCYEEWCLIERQRLQQLYLFALSRLAAFHTRRHEFIDSIACCQQILTIDPLREEVHRELIRLFVAAARPHDALRQFQACAAILQRELGIDPMPETLALFHQLPAQTWQTPPAERPLASSQPTASGSANHELQNILAHLASAAETVALASTQVRQALHSVEQMLARREGYE
jgi:DNA-binding SARP family transcriptional activator